MIMRGSNQPKRVREEKQRSKRQVKVERRAERRVKPSPLQAEIERCDGILGHPNTLEERNQIRQAEMAEIADYIARGRIESERLAAAKE